MKKPVDSVHEFYFGGYVHNVKVCHIVHTATARTQMAFSARLSDEAASLCTSTSAARAAPASSRSSSNSEDRDGSCLSLKLQSLLAGRSASSQNDESDCLHRQSVPSKTVTVNDVAANCCPSRQIARIQESRMLASLGNAWKNKWVS